MIDKLVTGTTLLEKSLDASWYRNDAISQNIANIDTPGYKKKKVSFEEYLSDFGSSDDFEGFRTDPRHIKIGKSSIEDAEINMSEENTNLEMRLDGNNVDIDSEMAFMAQNSIKYNVLIQRLSGKFKSIKSVISGGK